MRIRTLLGPSLTPAAVPTGSTLVCKVRTAGPRSAPTALLVNAPVTALSVSAPGLPLVVGGTQRQPSAMLTRGGVLFPTVAKYSSQTPSVLSVVNNLVHPVGSFPAMRQTGTVQGSACGLSGTAPLRTTPYNSLAGGYYHSLALSSGGGVVAWGYNGYGQTTVPAAAQSGVVAVAAGDYHSLALSAGGVVAWGYNGSGQTTVPAAAQSGVVAIAAGNTHSLALKANGSVVAWGYNSYGQTTVPAAAQSGVVAIAAGSFTIWR